MANSSGRPMIDCYEILEIPPNASLKDINSAYKKLALKLHPDKTGGDDIKFQQIHEAVEILRDPTSRREHDKEFGPRTRYPSEEELLFANPEYKGWTPKGMYWYNSPLRSRYTFSYRESVHMNPSSAQSQEELARWANIRQDQAKRQENSRRAAQFFAEEALKEAQDRKFTANPAAESLGTESVHREEHNDEASNGPEPVWWGGAEPEEEDYDVLEVENYDGTGNGSTGETEVDSTVNNAKVEIGLGSEYGAEFENGNNATSEAEPNPHTDAHVDADLEADVNDQSKVEPAVVEINTTYHAGSNTDATFYNIKPEKFVAIAKDTISNPETNPYVGSEIDQEISAAAETTSQDDCCVDVASFRRTLEEHMSLSVGWTSDALSPLTPFSSEAQFKEDPNSTLNAGNESAESIYYDFSDAFQSQSDNLGSETYHDFPTDNDSETISNSPFNDDSLVQLSDIQEFSEESVYPYLAPFVPFFTSKLANKNIQYTRQDFQAELRGMVMETYCGWLESLRVTIPGAAESEIALDPHDCRHLGFWKKEMGHEECEVCDMWRPIYMLVCPGCGIKKCVRCKFEEGK